MSRQKWLIPPGGAAINRSPALLIPRLGALLLVLVAPPAPCADVQQQRNLLLQAEKALGQGQPEEARRLAAQLTDYPLHPFLWAKILTDDRVDGSEIPAFLERYADTRYALPLRRKWLDYLIMKGDFREFLNRYPPTDDVHLQCDYYWVLHRIGREADARVGAEKLWRSGDPRPSVCDRLFAWWQTTPAYEPRLLWTRFGLALRKKQSGLVNYLRSRVPPQEQNVADFWLTVDGNPGLATGCELWQRGGSAVGNIFAHGIDRLAAERPLEARNVWNLRRNDFIIDPDLAAGTDRHLALALATDRYSEAQAELALMSQAVADAQTRTWQVRSALIKQDWWGVLEAIEWLEADERKEAEWRYWQARAREATGDVLTARMLYKLAASERDFYGLAAAARLQQAHTVKLDALSVSAAELEKLAATPALQRVREFRALNRQGEAVSEWNHTLKNLPPRDIAVAAHLARQWGENRLAMVTIARALPYDDVSLRFPLGYQEPVTRQAHMQGVDPALLFSLIRRESAFEPAARSGAGALGLMQIMPTTVQHIASLLKEPGRDARDMLDPDTNIRYGTAYFRHLMAHFNQHFVLVAAAYNAGLGKVDRWLPAGKPMPADIWIGTIPYLETRNYVTALLSSAVIYQGRLAGDTGGLARLLTDIPPGTKGSDMVRPEEIIPVPVCR